MKSALIKRSATSRPSNFDGPSKRRKPLIETAPKKGMITIAAIAMAYILGKAAVDAAGSLPE